MRYQSHWSRFIDPEPSITRRATLLGYYVLLHRNLDPAVALDAGHLARCVLPAIQQNRIAFYFDEFNQVVGCVIWALVAEDVRERVLAYGNFHLHESEWLEGDDLWIVELAAPFGHFKYMVRDLFDKRFACHDAVSYLRQRSDGLAAVQHDLRRRRSHARRSSRIDSQSDHFPASDMQLSGRPGRDVIDR